MNKQDNMSPTTIRIPIIILPEKNYLADTQDNEFNKTIAKYSRNSKRIWIDARVKMSKNTNS